MEVAPAVAVLGAGVAGLEAARRLTQAGIHVTLLEGRGHSVFRP
jgi:monoamine oxidase